MTSFTWPISRCNKYLFNILLTIFFVIYTSLVYAVETPAIAEGGLVAETQQEITQASPERPNPENEDSGNNNNEGENSDDSGFSIDLNLGETIKMDEAVQNWEARLESVLQQYGLNKSFVGKLVASLAIIAVALILSLLVRKFIAYLRKKTIPLVHRYRLNERRISFNYRITQSFINILIVIFTIGSLLNVWDIRIFSILPQEQVYWLLQSVVSIFAVVIFASLVMELAGGLVEKSFSRFGGASNTRMQTLMPIAKNLVFIVLFVLFGLTLLSELGINVMPLLAGAGVVGFAIGFGAQTFVKDLLTGFIIIFEDLIQVGDVVSVGGKSGLVEKITIRKIQLRNLEGIVSTVPFSEISIVDNYTKIFSYYLMDIGIAYRENTDNVIELLKKIDEELRADDGFKDDILEPIDILGVDSFADSAVIIKARIKTKPIQQWRIGREFNRRMKHCFDAENIEIPFPHRTIYFGEDKDGKAPPMYLNMVQDASNDTPEESQNRT